MKRKPETAVTIWHLKLLKKLSSGKPDSALLLRQVKVQEISTVATIVFSFALVITSFLQWRVSASLAEIEQAKFRPRLVVTDPQFTDDERLFLPPMPTQLRVQGSESIADIERGRSQITILVHDGAQRSLPMCGIAIDGFYEWNRTTNSFVLSKSASELIKILQNQKPQPTISLQYTWLNLLISYTDINGDESSQGLQFSSEGAAKISPDRVFETAPTTVRFLINPGSINKVILARTNTRAIDRDCAAVISDIDRLPGVGVTTAYGLTNNSFRPLDDAPNSDVAITKDPG